MNYSSIQALIADWSARDDLSGLIPRFIALTEERMNRALRVRQMEAVLPLTAIVDGAITMPADAVDVKLLWTSDPAYPLKPASLEAVVASGDTGEPTMFARQGGVLRFNGGGSVQGIVYNQIPELATDGTNWVSEEAHSAYLFGSMAEAAHYTGGDPTQWEARFQAVLSELAGNSNRIPGPLVARAR